MKQAVLFISLYLLSVVSADTGAAHVRGQLLCGGEPFAGEKVEVYEKNIWTKDSLVASGITDQHGYFSLKGSAKDSFFTPSIYIYIENYCVEVRKPVKKNIQCAESLKITLPEAFVATGNLPKTTFNMDELELKTAETQEMGLARIPAFTWLGGTIVCRQRPADSPPLH